MDYQAPVRDAKLPRGICHLVICSMGIGPEGLMAQTAATLNRITGDDGNVLVQVTDGASADDVRAAVRHLQEADFTVAEDVISDRVAPEFAERFGLFGAGRILVCSPSARADAPGREVIGHHH